MKITCPQCHFEREVPPERLPGKTAIATCPHCRHRFRIVCHEFRSPDRGLTPERIAQELRPISPVPGDTFSPESPSKVREQAPDHVNIVLTKTPQSPSSVPEQRRTDPSTPTPARTLPTPSETPDQSTPAPAAGSRPEGTPSGDTDDPLPPGAIIPRQLPSQEADHYGVATHTTPSIPTDSEDVPQYRHFSSPPSEPDGATQQDISHSEGNNTPVETPQNGHDTAQGQPVPSMDNPWDHPEREGYLAAFYQTSMRVMFAASRFFICLREESSKTRALSFFLLICVLQVLLERFWGGVLLQLLGDSADPQLRQVLTMLTPQMSLPMSLILKSAVSTLMLFFISGVYYAAFRIIAPEKANYALIFQILAYSAAPDLLCIVPVVGSLAGFVWSLACSLIGLRYALHVSWVQIAATVLPLYALTLMLIGFVSKAMAPVL